MAVVGKVLAAVLFLCGPCSVLYKRQLVSRMTPVFSRFVFGLVNQFSSVFEAFVRGILKNMQFSRHYHAQSFCDIPHYCLPGLPL